MAHIVKQNLRLKCSFQNIPLKRLKYSVPLASLMKKESSEDEIPAKPKWNRRIPIVVSTDLLRAKGQNNENVTLCRGYSQVLIYVTSLV